MKITNDIMWAMEHQKILSLVSIDLSAVFDTLDHEILGTSITKSVWNYRNSSSMV